MTRTRKVLLLVGLLLGLVVIATPPVTAQDLTTRLAYFLNDLYAGLVGQTLPTRFRAVDGTTASTAFGFTSEVNSGLIRAGAGTVSMIVGGTTTMSWGGGTVSLNAAGGQFNLASGKLFILTAPTISSGFGTSPSIVSNNFSATFRVNVGTGGVATSGVVGMPTATAGWNCVVSDITNNTVTRQTADTTTTVTVTAAAAWAASDVLLFHCMGF